MSTDRAHLEQRLDEMVRHVRERWRPRFVVPKPTAFHQRPETPSSPEIETSANLAEKMARRILEMLGWEAGKGFKK